MNEQARNIKPSGIRRFFDIANEMDDVISLSIGEPDFLTPWHIREAGITTLEKGTRYTPNRGLMALREEICAFFKKSTGFPIIRSRRCSSRSAAARAVDMALRCLVGPGGEVIIPEPCFVCYDPLTRMAGGVPVSISTKGGKQIPPDGRGAGKRDHGKDEGPHLPVPEQPDRRRHAPRGSGGDRAGREEARPDRPVR